MSKKEELLKRVDEVWDNPTYDDLLELVGDLARYIEKGE